MSKNHTFKKRWFYLINRSQIYKQGTIRLFFILRCAPVFPWLSIFTLHMSTVDHMSSGNIFGYSIEEHFEAPLPPIHLCAFSSLDPSNSAIEIKEPKMVVWELAQWLLSRILQWQFRPASRCVYTFSATWNSRPHSAITNVLLLLVEAVLSSE